MEKGHLFMTSNQLKAKEIANKESQFSRSHAETKRSNRAQEGIGRVNAMANVTKALVSPFKVKVGPPTFGDIPLVPLRNHIEWYKHSAVQLEAVAKLPYTKIKGGYKYYGRGGNITMTDKGIMIINYVDTLPVIGGSQGLASSPVNIIAQNLFSKLRSKVSGSITFEAADYMMYIMSVGSYYSFWSYLCRLYNILNNDLFKDSLYLRSKLVEEMGFKFADLDGNKLLLLTKINEFGSVLANFAIPNELDYFKRKLWLTSNIFVDHKELKFGSLYMLNPTHTFRYSDGLLNEVPIGGTTASTRWSLNQLTNVIDTIITSMSGNESWIDMSGQTKRAYDGSYFTFPTLQINTQLNIVYDEDILRQIQSADISIRPLTLTIQQVTDPDNVNYGVIYQGVNTDGLNFTVTNSFQYSLEALQINTTLITDCIFSNEDVVSVEDIARQTRFKSRVEVSFTSGANKTMYRSVATELVIGISVLATDGTVFRFEKLTNSLHTWADLSNYVSNVADGVIPFDQIFMAEVIKETYHYCPLLFFTGYTSPAEGDPIATDYYYYMPYVNNTIVTSCSNESLDAINRVCISSMLGLYDNLS